MNKNFGFQANESYIINQINDKQNIEKYKIYNEEEEFEAFKQLNEGNLNIRNQIINHNLRLVIQISKAYSSNQIPIDNLISFGIEGLIKAINKFDYKKGNKFSTYATTWIKQEIKIGLIKEKDIIRIPIPTIKNCKLYKKTFYHLLQKNNKKPTDQEISKITKLELSQIELIKKIPQEIISLQTPINIDDKIIYLEDIISDENNGYSDIQKLENKYGIIQIIENSKIDKITQEMILMQSGITNNIEMTQEEIGKTFKISKQAVNKRIKKVLPLIATQISNNTK